MFRHHNLKIGYFAQHHIDALNNVLSPLQHLQKLHPLAKEQELRSLLGSFGITGPLAIQVYNIERLLISSQLVLYQVVRRVVLFLLRFQVIDLI